MFARGDLNLLLATSVAEEGTEIPVANVVLRFDPIQNPVSLVQSRGRARQADSAFLVMHDVVNARKGLGALAEAAMESIATLEFLSF